MEVLTVNTPPLKPPSSAVRKVTIFSFLAAEGSCCEESEPEESPPEDSPPEEEELLPLSEEEPPPLPLSLEDALLSLVEALPLSEDAVPLSVEDSLAEEEPMSELLPAGGLEEELGAGPPQEPRARPSKAKSIFCSWVNSLIFFYFNGKPPSVVVHQWLFSSAAGSSSMGIPWSIFLRALG